MMQKISVAGMKVDAGSRQELVEEVRRRLEAGKKTFIVTPYSEFLYNALRDPATMQLVNSADLSIPDGIGVILAHAFLSRPYHLPGRALKWLEGWWQMWWLGWRLLLAPQSVYGPFTHKVVGADFVWDLAKLASEQRKSIYVLGGYGEAPALVAKKFQEKFPGLKIAGTSNKMKTDPSVIEDIQRARPDLLLVGFGPLTQEKWIQQHWDELPVTLAIGLGGTFDYIAGHKSAPPAWIRQIGLEWLYRLITQPARAGRIKNATFGLVNALINYKIRV